MIRDSMVVVKAALHAAMAREVPPAPSLTQRVQQAQQQQMKPRPQKYAKTGDGNSEAAGQYLRDRLRKVHERME